MIESMSSTHILPTFRLPELPLVAILRGLQPDEAADIGRALLDAGFRLLEVPLNRPGAIACIRTLTQLAPADALVGGGTMLSTEHVEQVREAGGQLMVSPNCDLEVIARARQSGMYCAPGVATPSEAFSALKAGAHALKLFPAEAIGTAGLKAFKSVLPNGTELWPVGGVSVDTIGSWVAAGATGFGIGTQLFKPGMTASDVAQRAREFVGAWQAAKAVA